MKFNRQLQADILDILVTATPSKAAHNQAGEESLSRVLQLLRGNGWQNLDTRSERFEDVVKAHGFSLRQVYHGQRLLTFVGV